MFVVDGEQVSVRVGGVVQPLLAARQPLAGRGRRCRGRRPACASSRPRCSSGRRAAPQRRRTGAAPRGQRAAAGRAACRCRGAPTGGEPPAPRAAQRRRRAQPRAAAAPAAAPAAPRRATSPRAGGDDASARFSCWSSTDVVGRAPLLRARPCRRSTTGDLEIGAGVAARGARSRAGVRQRARRVRGRAREGRRLPARGAACCAPASARASSPISAAAMYATLGDVLDARRRLLRRRGSVQRGRADAGLRGARRVGARAGLRAARPLSRHGRAAQARRRDVGVGSCASALTGQPVSPGGRNRAPMTRRAASPSAG